MARLELIKVKYTQKKKSGWTPLLYSLYLTLFQFELISILRCVELNIKLKKVLLIIVYS